MKFVNTRIIFSALLLIAFSNVAIAQRSLYYKEEEAGVSGVVKPTGHYEHWDYFGSEVSKTEPLIAQSLRPHNIDKKKEQQPKKEPTPKPIEQVVAKKPDPLKMEKEEFDKYVRDLAGDPSEKPFVEPNADAPPAFKAMQVCLQRGDYDCAGKYAEKYTQSNVLSGEYYRQIKKLTEDKLRKKGLLAESVASEEPDYENLNILESDQQDRNQETDENGDSGSSAQKSKTPDDVKGSGTIGRIPDTAGLLLREGEKREDQYVNKNRIVSSPPDDGLGGGEVLRMLSIPEDKQRKQASDQYYGVLPKDENGAVRVYFFFRSEDLNAYAMFPVLEKIFQAHKDDKGFMLLAFSLSGGSLAELKAMSAKVKVSFPLRSGSVIAEQMGISRSPTTLVVAPSSGSYAREEGIRGFGFIDELVRIVDGSGPTKKVPK